MPVPTRAKLKRRYKRKILNRVPIEHPTSPPQLAELAFNIHGWALEDGLISTRTPYEVINAYKATMIKGGFEAKVSEIVAGGNVGPVYREDLRFTQRELDRTLAEKDKSVCRYLIVGYTFQEDDPVFVSNKSFARYSDNELVGEHQPETKHIISWQHIRTPVYIVTPLKKNTGTSVRLFGLIMPRSGLCQPVLITHERIFYRWEYRASAGAKYTQRNKNWNQVVIDKAFELSTESERVSNHVKRDSFGMSEDESDAPYDDEDVDSTYACGYDDDGDSDAPYAQRRRSTRQPPLSRRSSRAVTIKQEYQSDEELPQINNIGQTSEAVNSFRLELVLDELFEPRAERYTMVDLSAQKGPSMTTSVEVMLNSDSRRAVQYIKLSQSVKIQEQVRNALIENSIQRQVLPVNNQSIISFFNLEIPFDEFNAMQLAQEIRTTWPTMAHLIDIPFFPRIKTAMLQSGETLTTLNAVEKFFETVFCVLKLYPRITEQELLMRYREALRISVYSSSHAPAARTQASAYLEADGVYLVILLKELYLLHQKQKELVRNMWQLSSLESLRTEHRLEVNIALQTPTTIVDAMKFLREGESQRNDIEDVLLWLERLRIQVRRG